jgi:hypothetical protein
MLTAWWLIVALVLNLFASSLAIMLAQGPLRQPLFATAAELHQLLTSHACRLVVPSGTPSDFMMTKFFIETALSLSSADTDSYQAPIIASDRSTAAKLVSGSRECLIGFTESSLLAYQKTLACGLEIIDLAELAEIPEVYFYRADGHFTPVLDTFFQRSDFFSFYARFTERSFRERRETLVWPERTVQTDRPLRLTQLAAAFWLAASAVGVACFVLYLERSAKRMPP